MTKTVKIADIVGLTGRDRRTISRWRKERPQLYRALEDAVRYQWIRLIMDRQ